MNKPTTFESFCYKKMNEGYLYRLRRAAKLLDAGHSPETVSNRIAGPQVLIGIWLFFACNYMVKTGVRPSND